MEPSDSLKSHDSAAQSLVVLKSPPLYNPTMDTAYVVLGFLCEYLGRRIVKNDSMVEHFFPNEVAAADEFEKFLLILREERGLPPPLERILDEQGHICFASLELANLINSYYTAHINIDRKSTRLNKRPFLYECNQFPYTAFKPIKGARLEPDEFNSRFSFLLGAYKRYGHGNAYTFANSSGKAALIRELLCDVGCDYVGWKAWMKRAPCRFVVEFEPTEDLNILFGLSDTDL